MIFENPRIFLLNKTKVNKFEEQVIFFSQFIWEICVNYFYIYHGGEERHFNYLEKVSKDRYKNRRQKVYNNKPNLGKSIAIN